MIDPLVGRDGTQAVDGADALAPPPRGPEGGSSVRGAAVGPSETPGLPALPALPVAADHDAVARWMDADAVAARRLTDPPGPRPAAPAWVDGDTVEDAGGEGRLGRVRDAGPPRLLPRDERPPPRRPESARPDPVRPDPARPDPAPDDGVEDPEPEWLRERREEHEFRSQFGEWRSASGPVATGGPGRPATPLRPATLGILLALAVLIVVVALA